MRKLISAIAVFLSVSVGNAVADELADASMAMCERMKECAAAQMGQDVEGLSKEMKAMIMNSLEAVCDGIEENFSGVKAYPDLYQPATACMRSMAQMTCEQLENQDDDNPTPECAAFNAASEKYRTD